VRPVADRRALAGRELEVGFVNEGRGVERVAAARAANDVRQAAELVVGEGVDSPERRLIAGAVSITGWASRGASSRSFTTKRLTLA
jgi:hypothetical protein